MRPLSHLEIESGEEDEMQLVAIGRVAERVAAHLALHCLLAHREFFIDNLLVRVHLIIVMIGWTGLATDYEDPPLPAGTRHHQPSERDQISFFRALICTGAHQNLAACGTTQGY